MLGELREPPVKKTKGHPYFIPELAYILASCEERIPLVNLGLEVSVILSLSPSWPTSSPAVKRGFHWLT
jgi:hypothetical protein